MTLEVALAVAGIALAVSAFVNFALTWAIRVRVGRAEVMIDELDERTSRAQKREAAAKSVAKRTELGDADARIVEAITRKHQAAQSDVEQPWWGGIVGRDKFHQ